MNHLKKLGFGMMRLPMRGDEVDIPQTCRMVDRFLEEGFTYFDTAHGAFAELLRLKEKGKVRHMDISCGLCEKACPQHIEIRSLLREIVAEFNL